MRRNIHLALLLLPVLGIGIWMGMLAMERSSAPQMQIAIRGYDPRDLLRGHYLEFRLDLGGEASGPACLFPNSTDPIRPTAGPPSPGCKHPIAQSDRSYRFYMEEEQALELQRLLMEGAEAVTVLVHFNRTGPSFSDIQVGTREP